MGRARVFIATSLDGFIAGPDHELDWLDGHKGAEDTFTPFFSGVGALLMGRRTYDVVRGFDVPWPYGDTPVLVATSRELDGDDVPEPVRAVSGSIEDMMAEARSTAGDEDVYVDGGRLIRSALVAGLIDAMTVTVIPTILGAGIPLFAGLEQRVRLDLDTARPIGGGLVELVYRPRELVKP